MNNRGMTMLEVMFAVSIFTIVMAVIFGMGIGFGDTAEVEFLKATATDEARRAMQSLIPDLRQAVRSSINWAELPGEVLMYSVAEDLDGNGTAVDQSGRLEVSAPRLVSRDTEDANGDLLSVAQLIVTQGETVRVLANNLSPDAEAPDAEGNFGTTEDTNNNGRLDQGIWFEPWERGLRVTIQTQGTTRRGHVLRTTVQEVVFPMN